eukprot:GHVP01060915.1.p1 GENE.GHVP01060915.1~~GHVP01060915.1.p1  ORF type:complete len:448 (+),score=54.38 GHVP01060915.1:1207-2550(+)
MLYSAKYFFCISKMVAAFLISFVCETLGPTFVKLGQWAAQRSELLNLHTRRQLSKRLHTLTSEHSFVETQIRLSEEFGENWTEWLWVFPGVVGSGSIAQVHRAVNQDGKIIAVKVQHPQIEKRMNRELAILRLLSSAAQTIPGFGIFPIKDSFAEFENSLKLQLDFNHERNNLIRFRKRFRKYFWFFIPRMKQVPRIYSKFPSVVHQDRCPAKSSSCRHLGDCCCKAHVLLQSFEEGNTICKLLDNNLLDFDTRRDIAKKLLDLLYKMIVRENFIHCDMHSGNILYDKLSRTMTLVDVGMSTSLNRQDRKNFLETLRYLLNYDGKKVGELITERARNSLGVIPESFVQKVGEIVSELKASKIIFGSHDFGTFVFRLISASHKYGVELHPSMTNLMTTIAVVEGVQKELDPKFDLLGETRDKIFSPYKNLWKLGRIMVFRNKNTLKIF